MKKFLVLLSVVFILSSCGNKESKKEVVVPEKKEEVVVVKEEIKEAPKTSLIFTVQIGANKRSSAVYSSIKDVIISKEKGMFKYRIGAFNSYKEAKKYRREILSKYPGSFIQALRNSEPISIANALK